MRKAAKTLFVMLAVSCLALCSLMASPSTWAWAFGGQSSEASAQPAESSEELIETFVMESPSSESISTEDGDELIVMRKSDLLAAIAKFESAAGRTAKAQNAVAEAKATVEETATPYVPAPEAKAPKFQEFMTLDAEANLGLDMKYGFSLGFIFKNCLIGSVGVMKAGGIGDWMNKELYTGKVSLGIVF